MHVQTTRDSRRSNSALATAVRFAFTWAAVAATIGICVGVILPAARRVEWPRIPTFGARDVGHDAATRRLERDRMTRMFEAFHYVSMLTAIPDGQTTKHTSPATDSAVYAELERGLAAGDSVSDAYLDWLDPTMKQHLRKEYLLGNRLYLDGLRHGDTREQVIAIRIIGRWQEFWGENGPEITRRAVVNGEADSGMPQRMRPGVAGYTL